MIDLLLSAIVDKHHWHRQKICLIENEKKMKSESTTIFSVVVVFLLISMIYYTWQYKTPAVVKNDSRQMEISLSGRDHARSGSCLCL